MPDRYVFRTLLALGCWVATIQATSAQVCNAYSIQAGPAFLAKPHWFSQGPSLLPDGAPTVQMQAEWYVFGTTQLRLQAVGRNGWWARQDVSHEYGPKAAWGGQLYQLGTGLRYYNWLNLGRWLVPFAGLTVSGARVSSHTGRGLGGMVDTEPPPTHRRWTALLGAELGVQAWLTKYSGPTLTLTAYHSLLPYFTPFNTTEYEQRGQGSYAYDVRTRPLRGQAALQLGWRWQPPFNCQSLPSYRTPRYSQ